MMLRALLPGNAQRYAFAGLALGSALPVFGLVVEFFLPGSQPPAGTNLSKSVKPKPQ